MRVTAITTIVTITVIIITITAIIIGEVVRSARGRDDGPRSSNEPRGSTYGEMSKARQPVERAL